VAVAQTTIGVGFETQAWQGHDVAPEKRAGVYLLRHGSCGSWLACDAGAAVYLTYGVDAIAGKPGSPTGSASNPVFEVSVSFA
jgi:hypothetical protein